MSGGDANRRDDDSPAQGLPATARRVHFVGVGGVGMSGIAEMMSGLGYEVTGSDLTPSAATDRLGRLGIPVQTPHRAACVGDADAVVVSAAIPDDNPEVLEARRRQLPVIRRGVMLAGLTRSRATVAVTGTHGKSTTSSMVAVMLADCGLDPSAVIGARVPAFDGNTRVGGGAHFVVEADESEPSLLELTPEIAVITNLEEEHLEQYGSFDNLRDTIVRFAHRVPASGTVVLCADDPELDRLRDRIDRRIVTYGLAHADADVAGEAPVLEPDSSSCRVRYRHAGSMSAIDLQVGVPGRHNLLNALAAFAVGLTVRLDPDRVAQSLGRFAGVDRRFQLKGVADGVQVFDDYAHHPTEIAALIETARRRPHERLVALFQPHRYSRTERFLLSFASALARADLVVLTDVYAAGESARPAGSVERLADAVRRASDRPVRRASTLDDAVSVAAGLARPGDLVLTIGAGSIGSVGDRILAAIRDRRSDETPPPGVNG